MGSIKIANELLKIGKDKRTRLTPMQLVKLVYIAHARYLAQNKKPLISDRIEAWKYGPIIPKLYHVTKHYGKDSIPFEAIGLEGSNLDKETFSFLQGVFKKYGHMTGIQLSSLTHRKGGAWEKNYTRGATRKISKSDIYKEGNLLFS